MEAARVARRAVPPPLLLLELLRQPLREQQDRHPRPRLRSRYFCLA